MIAHIRGKIEMITPTSVVIDCNGVGYEIHISLHIYGLISNKQEEIKLYTYMHVREDAQLLYGFSDLSEKEMFLHLISVNGVGANTAMLMLSAHSAQALTEAILQSDVNFLKSIKGIGAKTAQRIIVDLQDKLGKSSDVKISAVVNNKVKDETLSALTMLGFNKNQAEKTVVKILKSNPEINVEQAIKEALKLL